MLSFMRVVPIAKVSLDESSRLQITPELLPTENYADIYRAAMSVRWNPSLRSLYVVASDLDLIACYKQILAAVADECGHQLVLAEATEWSNIPDSLKSSIKCL